MSCNKLLLVLFVSGCLCALFGTSTLKAQSFKYIGVENGLSNRRVIAIQKGLNGYMWFLTQDGIDRYDGKNFKNYLLKVNGREENSLWNLNWLYTDSRGGLWEIGKRGRVFAYDINTDSFKPVYDLRTENKQLTITYGFLDNEDYIWLCTSQGIYRYNCLNGKCYLIKCNLNEQINTIEQIDNTHYLMGTDKGIHYIELIGKELHILPHTLLKNTSLHINDIFYHRPTRKVFIGTFQEGVYVYEPTTQQIKPLENELKDITINCIRYFNENEILIGTDGTGVYKINVKSYHTEPFIVADYTSYNAMNGNNISDIYIDNEKRIWMANYPFGITVQDERYPKYKWIKHSKRNKQSLVNDQINAIIEDLEGDLWFATNNGVSRYCPHNGQWYTYLSSFNPKIQNNNHTFLSLCEIRPGEIMVGGYNSGLYLINKWTGEISYHTPATFATNELRPDKYIRTLLKDKNGKVWCGGYYNLKEIDLENNVLRHIQGLNGITVIKEKDDKHLWIGTANGLFLLEKESGEYINIQLPAESNFIYSLLQMPDGMLYIGTNNAGLLIYNHADKTFEHYHKDNCALISNNIYNILFDGIDRLVLSMENGLCNFNIKEKRFINWTKEHGLMSDHFNASSGTLRKNGNFIFGSTDGAIEYNKGMRLPHNHQFKMVFDNLRIFNRIVYPNEEDSPLTQTIDKTETLQLKHNQNMIAIEVSTINFDNPSLVLYTWALEGFYNEWSEPSRECNIRFTNLSPGKYTLKVKAISSEDKRITLEERKINIIIEQSFWLSPWGMLLYAFILMLSTIIYLRFDMMRKKRKLSEERINFFINTAHDLRTPLTLIKAPLEEMEQNEPLTTRGRESIYTALRNVNALLRLTTNLVNVERAESETSKLVIGEIELNSYINNIIGDFSDYTNFKRIRLNFESNVDDLHVWIDGEKMESILKNIISNALKYTPEEGYVEVKLNKKREMWCIEIKDTGIGIPEKEQKNLFKTHFRGSNAINAKTTGSGMGLLLVSKLVKRHKGKLSFESKEGKGTTITLLFPIDKTAYPNAIAGGEIGSVKRITDSHTRVPTNIPKQLGNELEENWDGHKKKVLIVEDNDELRSYLKETLSNYSVQTSNNGEDALLIVKEFAPDIIISDILMPGMRGDELCEAVKNDINTSHIPVILLTALCADEEVISGLKHGADEYITKPFSMNVLRASIENQLMNRSRLQARFNKLKHEEVGFDELKLDYSNELDWKFLARVKEEIEAEISNSNYNVEILCSRIGMSRTSFTNKLRALTGYLPADFIRQLRLNHAITLLKEQKHNINEIAELCGFNDAKYFREVFKKYYHTSPSNYLREENRKKEYGC